MTQQTLGECNNARPMVESLDDEWYGKICDGVGRYNKRWILYSARTAAKALSVVLIWYAQGLDLHNRVHTIGSNPHSGPHLCFTAGDNWFNYNLCTAWQSQTQTALSQITKPLGDVACIAISRANTPLLWKGRSVQIQRSWPQDKCFPKGK